MAERVEVKLDTVPVQRILLTVKEAADEMSVSVSQAYELVAQGRIPHVKLGPRCIRVPFDALRQTMNKEAEASVRTAAG